MNVNENPSLRDFLETSDYIYHLNESIREDLKEEAELDGNNFDLNDVYWADRFYYKRMHAIKREFSAHGIHL